MYAFFTCTDKPCILSAHVRGNHQVEPLLSTACPQFCAERSATMNSLIADMLKVHESDVKQLVTAQYKSSCQTQLVVWACHGPSKTWCDAWQSTSVSAMPSRRVKIEGGVKIEICRCMKPDCACAAIRSRHPWRSTMMWLHDVLCSVKKTIGQWWSCIFSTE